MQASDPHGLRAAAGVPLLWVTALRLAVSLTFVLSLTAGAPDAATAGVTDAARGAPVVAAASQPLFTWVQAAVFAWMARPASGAAGILACTAEAASFVWADARLAEGAGRDDASRQGDRLAPANHPPWMDRLFRLVSDSGAPPTLAVGLAGLAVVDPPGALEAATAAAGGLAITGAGKVAAGRIRPDALGTGGPAGVGPEGVVVPEARAFLYAGPAGALAGGDARMSMPSGHAAGAFAVASVLARRYPGATWAAYLWASAVALSRVYLGRHWPSDVGAGAHLGRWWGRGP